MLFFIDTVSLIPKIVLSHNNNIIKFTNIPINNDLQISESIITELYTLFTNNKNFNKINSILVCSGPGSYTGLRMGISVAIGLKNSLNIPIYGLSAFDILLNYARKKLSYKEIFILIQSNNNQNFISKFDKEGNKLLQTIKLKELEDLETKLINNASLISNEKVDKNFSNKFSSFTYVSICEIMVKYNVVDIKNEKNIIQPLYY